MQTDKKRSDFEKPSVDEAYLMSIMSNGEKANEALPGKLGEAHSENKSRERSKAVPSKKVPYEETFLINRFPSGRSGKVVYIRPEFHERLLRIVQLTREERTTLYSYIDNILEYHFREFGADITDYFNNHYKPIL